MEDPMSATPLLWCPDCKIYYAAHPFDHLDQKHPPQYPDGSRALPERIEVEAA